MFKSFLFGVAIVTPTGCGISIRLLEFPSSLAFIRTRASSVRALSFRRRAFRRRASRRLAPRRLASRRRAPFGPRATFFRPGYRTVEISFFPRTIFSIDPALVSFIKITFTAFNHYSSTFFGFRGFSSRSHLY